MSKSDEKLQQKQKHEHDQIDSKERRLTEDFKLFSELGWLRLSPRIWA